MTMAMPLRLNRNPQLSVGRVGRHLADQWNSHVLLSEVLSSGNSIFVHFVGPGRWSVRYAYSGFWSSLAHRRTYSSMSINCCLFMMCGCTRVR